MNKKTLFAVVVALLIIAGCTKSTDNASKWVGTYTTTSGGIYPNTFNQVVITETGDNTINIAADTVFPGGTPVYTWATLMNVNVGSNTSASFSQTDAVLGFTNPLLLSGSVTLNGNILTLLGTGVNTGDTIAYYFYGTKQ